MTIKNHNLYPVYQDYAIVLAWPDTTARGDHKWCDVLKKSGLLKNKNFKVGHAAIVLIEKNGKLHYFDFGRYVTPRGSGRARSKDSDPKLRLSTIAEFAKIDASISDKKLTTKVSEKRNHLLNLDEIINEIESKKVATHGKGPLYFSIVDNIDFELGYSKAVDFVNTGSMIYSAFMPGNSNCSRFVESVLISGLPTSSTQRKKMFIHETIVSSPISNVVNASCDGYVYRAENGVISAEKMSRIDSMKFFVQKTISNFRHDLSKDLPDDSESGHTNEPQRPVQIPKDAQWLGGIGEGGWFYLDFESTSTPKLTKYSEQGEVEFERFVTSLNFKLDKPFQITYDTHAQKMTINQDEEKIVHELIDIPKVGANSIKNFISLNQNTSKTQLPNALQYSEI
ncbi:MAG TPA: hypothetical protein DCE78_05110 [Bacteroidetes bacterium]|nr:hypothetical protein [Bacteroidota bacterium]